MMASSSCLYFSFALYKLTTTRAKEICNAFIHEIEKLLSKNDVIPLSIFEICAIYYFHEHLEKCANFMDINNAKNIATIKSNNKNNQIFKPNKKINRKKLRGTVYGHYMINSQYDGYDINIYDNSDNNIYEWTLKIDQMSSWITIGIDSSLQKHINDDFSDQDGYTYYAYGSSGYIYQNKYDFRSVEYGIEYKTNDEIKMVLNKKNRSIKYYVNDKDQGIAFNLIHIKYPYRYHFAVCLAEGTIVRLISFQTKQSKIMQFS